MAEAAQSQPEQGKVGWSVKDGVIVPQEAINASGLKLINIEAMANMPAGTRRKLLAVDAATRAFELSNPSLQKATGAREAFQRQAAKEATGDTDLDASYLQVMVEHAQNREGMGHLPIIDTIEKMHIAGIIDDQDTYWRSLAIVSHLYAREIGLKSDDA